MIPIKLHFESVDGSALLMNSERGVNSLDELTLQKKPINAKKHLKTESDYEKLKRLDFESAIYFDDSKGPFIPALNILACLRDGAKKQRLGKTFLSAIFMAADIPLEYDGPRTINGLYAKKQFVDYRPVKVGTSKVMKCRPKFEKWGITFILEYDETVINKTQLLQAAGEAGRYCGICDFRPQYGRFTVTEITS